MDTRDEYLKEVRRQARRVAKAKADLNRAIVAARHQGNWTLREIAPAADLSHQSIANIVAEASETSPDAASS
jgi:predicted transcriptional regulator